MYDDRQMTQLRNEVEPELCSRYVDELYRDDMPYCDYCEREGHEFRACPDRDDDMDEEGR